MTPSVQTPPSSPCCFEVLEPGRGGVPGLPAPPQGGFLDLNATCSHLSGGWGAGAVSCDTPAAALTMANRTLFIRSELAEEGRQARGPGGEGRGGLAALERALALWCLAWTHSYKLRAL